MRLLRTQCSAFYDRSPCESVHCQAAELAPRHRSLLLIIDECSRNVDFLKNLLRSTLLALKPEL